MSVQACEGDSRQGRDKDRTASERRPSNPTQKVAILACEFGQSSRRHRGWYCWKRL